MKENQADLLDIRDKELQLQTLVQGSDKQDLAQCVRLISMYVSMYKKHFGELPADCYQEFLTTGAVDENSASIFACGLTEAISMMDTVLSANLLKDNLRLGNITIN